MEGVMNDPALRPPKEPITDQTRSSHAWSPRLASSGSLYTLDELAKLAGVSRRFLETEIRRGHLVVIRMSTRVVRVKAGEWERYLDRSTTPPAT